MARCSREGRAGAAETTGGPSVNINQARKRQKSWSPEKQQVAGQLLSEWNEGTARREFQGADFEALQALRDERSRRSQNQPEPAGVH